MFPPQQIISVLLTGTAVLLTPVIGQTYSQEDVDSGKVLAALSRTAYETAMSRLPIGECTKENVQVRKEWRKMPVEERSAYREAVECLMQRPSRNADIEGAKSSFDDFGVLHQQLTPYVHNSASFLTFHRYYINTYSQKLKEECGYEGAVPYWEWGLDCADVDNSPLFDGSPSSLGGNGEKVDNPGGGGGFGFGGAGGTGGGCLKEGPFSNFTVNMGPSTLEKPLGYNPRCIKRNLNGGVCAGSASIRNTTDAITSGPNVELFQAILQGDFRYPEARGVGAGVHGGGHFTIGGDPGGDFWFSPLEPVFYLHHGQIDRMYFVWQNQDWENRQDVAGTITMMNRPPSRNGTLDDILDFSPISGNRTLGELIDTVAGTPLCYVYE